MRGDGLQIGDALKMARMIPDIRQFITLEQAGLLMRAAYEMGVKRGQMPEALADEIKIMGGEG